jgi:uncharacterized membrane protein HdeD (DUF308 family)
MATTLSHNLEYEFRGFHSLRPHTDWLMFLGFALIVLGCVAIGLAFFSTLASVFVLGVLLVVAGVAQGVHAFSTRPWTGFFVQLLAAIFYLVAGGLMIANPMASAMSLTLFLAAFFMCLGVFRAVGAIASRHPRWGWQALSGVISFILGLCIFLGWPATALWVIGTFLGVELIVNGASLISIAAAARTFLPLHAAESQG